MELPISSSFFSARKNPQKIEAKNLTYHIHSSVYNLTRLFRNDSNPSSSSRVVLQDVTCDAVPGELTAIAGPSGAGKTSLLEILGAIIHPSKVSAGKVVVNGRPVDPGSLRRLSGHVTQDEALFPLLTVEETLMYSALLRLPGNRAEAKSRVQQLMKELGLDHIATSRIQSGGSGHGISGGEKRRVSIGVELVHDPSVLLIDEPTSGLDSAAALHVITLLKSMAVKQGKTIVITIHQPGFRILQLLDRVILLSNGLLLHNGPLNFLEHKLKIVGHDIPRRVNVLEFAIDVAYTLPAEPSHSLFLHHSNNDSIANFNLTFPNTRFQEILILGQRFCRNIFRTKQLFATRIIQSCIAGLILGTIFMNSSHDQGQLALQTRLGFFAFTLTFLLSSTTEGLPIFLQERRILMRETSRSAYRVSSYVLANTLVFIPFLLLVGLLYATPVYFLVGLRRDSFAFLYFSLVVWLVVLMSNSLVACFSALVPNFIMGTSVIAGLMGSFFLFSGYFITKESIPDYWVFMYYLSLFKYPFACFMINEYGGKQGRMRCVQRRSNGGVCELYGDELLRQQGIKEDERWTNLGMMLCFVVGYRLLSFVILWFRCHRTKN